MSNFQKTVCSNFPVSFNSFVTSSALCKTQMNPSRIGIPNIPNVFSDQFRKTMPQCFPHSRCPDIQLAPLLLISTHSLQYRNLSAEMHRTLGPKQAPTSLHCLRSTVPHARQTGIMSTNFTSRWVDVLNAPASSHRNVTRHHDSTRTARSQSGFQSRNLFAVVILPFPMATCPLKLLETFCLGPLAILASRNSKSGLIFQLLKRMS